MSARTGSALRIASLGALGLLAGCGTAGRLGSIGRAPKMSPVEQVGTPQSIDSLATVRGDPASPAPESVIPSASLFRTGAGALFQDQRAGRVGDILTIRVNVSDKAVVDTSTARSRDGSESGGASALFGLEKIVKKLAGVDTSKLVESASTSKSSGSGNTSRSETVTMTIAAVVTAVLPNGNLLIRGRQETRVNFELRELLVSGIVRPQDIARDNSIRHTQIAEARISYGGRGQLTDAQQARWGQQLMDVLSPF
ncbi:flagellar basal body L-ring protein FlgH [Sphingobium subterraneum]|uniref:Flagellar L-ring protein n=1 Tax=Sphingobium subterraneum TaxID=627688 RepID=A0A841IZS1_9SPHN|nr:flagellar basal body L-ring protein FlgH [Sphingobium subterraneum]MBB6122766.1 flagellar L-ring protein precursor FlgH [Sphingobium subterraneum]